MDHSSQIDSAGSAGGGGGPLRFEKTAGQEAINSLRHSGGSG